MDWFYDNLQLILVVAGALAAWLSNRKKGAGAPGTDDDEAAPPASPLTGQDDSQTRRIQDEIRRKIAERRGQAAPEPWAAPAEEPMAPPPLTHAPPPLPMPRTMTREVKTSLRDRLEAKLAQARAQVEAAERARSASQQERMRRLEAEQAATEKVATDEHHRQVLAMREADAAVVQAAVQARQVWLTRLRQPQEVRQAVVLREILGPPVGLR